MNKLYIYDATDDDKKQLKGIPDGVEVNFLEEALTVETAKPDAGIVSVFVNSEVSAEVMERMPKLKFIACRSTGYDNVDLKEATKRHIQVATVPNYGEHTVAEYTIGLLLTLSRKIVAAQVALARGETDHDSLQGHDLYGKTLGVVGAGHIGINVAVIGRGLGMNVLAFDSFPNPDLAAKYEFEYADLHDLLGRSDIVSLHVPHLASTTHMIGTSEFEAIRPGALMVNTSRGEVIDTEALIGALQSGKLGGAALDVFEGEAYVGVHEEMMALRARKTDKMVLEQHMALSILQKLPNVVLTNHNAFNTAEAAQRIRDVSAMNIAAFLGNKPENVVNA